MPSLRSRSCLVGIVVAITLACGLMIGRAAAPAQPSLVEPTIMAVDPATSNTSGQIRLTNLSAAPITKILLSVGPFISKTSGLDVGAKATFEGADDGGKPTFAIDALAPNAVVLVKIDVTNLWEAGEAEAALYNNGTEIGKVRAVKYRPAFGVKLVSAGATGEGADTHPVLEFQEGISGQMTLKNEDAMTYPVGWELTVGGKTIKSTQPVLLPPSSTIAVSLPPPAEWFSSVNGYFRDETRDGTLNLTLQPPLSTAYPLLPQSSQPVKVTLRNTSPAKQTALALLVVFVALLAGALSSLLMRDFIPNRLRRIKLSERLEEVDRSLQKVAARTKDSSLSVPVSVERTRLLAVLEEVPFYNPEIKTVFTQTQKDIDTLNKRIGVMQELANLWDLLWQKQKSVAPTLILEAREKASDGILLLKRTEILDKNLDGPKAQFAAARETLAGSKDNDELKKTLAARVTELGAVFTDDAIKGAYASFEPQIAKLRPAIDPAYADPENIPSNKFFEVDMGIRLLDLIRGYVKAKPTDPAKPELQIEYDRQLKPLQSHLEKQNYDGLRDATNIVKQAQQGIFSSTLINALKAPNDIYVEGKGTVKQNQSTRLAATFFDKDFNHCVARDSLSCLWEFDHKKTAEPVRSKGWETWHYFPDAGDFPVKLSFIDEATRRPIVKDNGEVLSFVKSIKVEDGKSPLWGERAKIEAMLFLVTLFAALVALIAGARENLQKPDIAAALIAIFLLGFSADTVKNLLTASGRDEIGNADESEASAAADSAS